MKKTAATLTALVLVLSLGLTAQAGNHMGGMRGGCGNCNPEGPAAPSDLIRKFQVETIDMRQEMMLKRFEIQRENLKASPDNTKISSLQAEVKAIQARINDIRVQNGLPENKKRDGECGPKSGMNFKSGCGQMGGCNGGPCGSK